jgi:hypothetical protein
MTWLAWRHLRLQAAAAALALAVVTVVLVPTGRHLAHVPDPRDLSTFYQSLRLLGTALIGVPAAIGAFWGAPLVARELENGTHRLAWGQSATRTRWLAVKLVVVGAVAATLTAAFSFLFTWWSLPMDRVGNRIGTANFGQRGFVPVAYALFALALGTFLGLVLRKTLPAMAATLAGFFVVRFGVQLLRPHLLDPVQVNVPLFGETRGAWIGAGRTTVDAAGQRFVGGDNHLAALCHLGRTANANDPTPALAACAERLGVHDVVSVHPASQFWAFQAWEAAIFAGLAVALVLAAFWWLRNRVT